MISQHRYLGTGVLAGLTAMLIAGCGTEDPQEAGHLRPHLESRGDPSATPKPVAEYALPNGNTVEFYDFGSGVLISELGKAGTNPAVDSKDALMEPGTNPSGGDKLAALWKSVAPDREMPAALRDIRQRWANAGALPSTTVKPPLSTAFSGIPMGPQTSPSNPLPKVAAPVGCNNGCCDEAWLRTLSQCSVHLDYSWFLFNYGYSYANSNGVDWFRGLVCSATGTSSWKVNVSDGSGGTWSIPQAHYRTYYWIAGLIDRDVRSSVNTSSNQALHTYCGSVSY